MDHHYTVPVTIDLPVSEWEPAVEVAVAHGSTLQDTLRNLLQAYVAEGGGRPPAAKNVTLTVAEVLERRDVDRLLHG
jgi:hypothetical protein